MGIRWVGEWLVGVGEGMEGIEEKLGAFVPKNRKLLGRRLEEHKLRQRSASSSFGIGGGIAVLIRRVLEGYLIEVSANIKYFSACKLANSKIMDN